MREARDLPATPNVHSEERVACDPFLLAANRLTIKVELEEHSVANSCVRWIAAGADPRGTRA